MDDNLNKNTTSYNDSKRQSTECYSDNQQLTAENELPEEMGIIGRSNSSAASDPEEIQAGNQTRPIRDDNPEHDQLVKDGIDAIRRNADHMTKEQLRTAVTELKAGSQRNDHNQLCDRINSDSFQG